MSSTAIMEVDPTQSFAALTGNRGFLEDQIGFGPVTRAARLVLAAHLNANITKQAGRWGAEDLKLQELGFDPGIGQIEVELVPIDHLHEGPHRSFLEAPPEAFPNVSVMAYITTPAAETSQFDQFDTSELTLFVETMVAAGPVPDGQDTAFETIVHRRIQRTTEAVHAALRADKTLLGTVEPTSPQPRGGIGPATWLRRRDGGQGPRIILHGSRLQYTLQRHGAF